MCQWCFLMVEEGSADGVRGPDIGEMPGRPWVGAGCFDTVVGCKVVGGQVKHRDGGGGTV